MKTGKLSIFYPRVQYRIVKNEGMIIGIEEGATIVLEMAAMLKTISIKGIEHEIVEKKYMRKWFYLRRLINR